MNNLYQNPRGQWLGALIALLFLLPLSMSSLAAQQPCVVVQRNATNAKSTNTNAYDDIAVAMLGLLSDGSETAWVLESGGTFTEFSDGTAVLQGTLKQFGDLVPRRRLAVNLTFGGQTFTPPVGSPYNLTAVKTDDWSYYTSISGTFTGLDALAGGQLNIALHMHAFQVGTGANQVQDSAPDLTANGATGWFEWTVVSQPTDPNLQFTNYIAGQTIADFSLLLSGNPTVPCTALAGSVTITTATVNLINGSATVSASATVNSTVPAGFQVAYVLTKGDLNVINQISATPTFTVHEVGKYCIYVLVYNPATLDLNIISIGIATPADVNALFFSGGGCRCASINLQGNCVTVGFPPDPCLGINTPTPSVTIVQPNCTNPKGSITITNLPAGFSSRINGGVWTVGKTYYTDLCPGTYIVTIGKNGCDKSCTAIITLGTSTPTPIVTVVHPSCNALGSITIVNLPAGYYSQLNGCTWTKDKIVYSGLCAGTYRLCIGNYGCNKSITVVLTPNNTVSFDLTKCYKIVNRESGHVLDVASSAQCNNGRVQQANYCGCANQQWQLSCTGNGFFKFKAQHSGKFLTSSGTCNGAPVYQYDACKCGSNDWKIECYGDGLYKIVNRLTGKYLDATDAKKDYGRVGVWERCDRNSQFWAIVEVPCAAPTQHLASSTTFDFTAQAEVSRARVEWLTNTSYRDDYYVAQKLNTTTGDFEDVQTVNNTNSDDVPQFYTVYDNAITEGEQTYRIKTVLNSGDVAYSALRSVNFKGLAEARIFPNPTTDEVQIDLSNYVDRPVDVYLSNDFGQIITTVHIEKAMRQPYTLDVSAAGAGNYTLRIAAKDKRDFAKRLVITK